MSNPQPKKKFFKGSSNSIKYNNTSINCSKMYWNNKKMQGNYHKIVSRFSSKYCNQNKYYNRNSRFKFIIKLINNNYNSNNNNYSNKN